VGPRVDLDAVEKRKIPSLCRNSNPRTPIIQPVAQCSTTELFRLPRYGRVRKTICTMEFERDAALDLNLCPSLVIHENGGII
jgi:hypothetical protein